MESTYMPKYHLYPTNPQILHHLVIELFVLAPQHSLEETPFFSLVPSGPIYKYGAVLAAQRKQIFQSHPHYKNLILIAGSNLPDEIDVVTTSDKALHSFFGTILLDSADYQPGVLQDSEIFSMHAKGLEGQLPFIRGYKHLDSVSPYIVNTSRSQEDINKILDGIVEYHGEEACYVFVQPEKGVEKFVEYVEAE